MVKESFNVGYCKLENESIQIADQKILLKDIDFNYEKIQNNLMKNRNNEKTNDYSLN